MLKSIFTDSIWVSSFKTNLKDYCDFVRKHDTGRNVSNTGGYQSNNLNLKEPVIQPLIQFITAETNTYLTHFQYTNTSVNLQSMWININGYKDYNNEHTHIGGGTMFSGVYYVYTPKDCGKIEFIKSSFHLMALIPSKSYSSFNNLNSASWSAKAKKDLCFIFPYYYIHKVQPNLNKEEERYSISFNFSLNP